MQIVAIWSSLQMSLPDQMVMCCSGVGAIAVPTTDKDSFEHHTLGFHPSVHRRWQLFICDFNKGEEWLETIEAGGGFERNTSHDTSWWTFVQQSWEWGEDDSREWSTVAKNSCTSHNRWAVGSFYLHCILILTHFLDETCRSCIYIWVGVVAVGFQICDPHFYTNGCGQ